MYVLPTLDDNGSILWDGHAINTYLIAKYADDNHESDIKKRAQIDQFLHFNGRTLFLRFFTFVMDVYWRGCLNQLNCRWKMQSKLLTF